MDFISGFSRLSKHERLKWLVEGHMGGGATKTEELKKFWHEDPEIQKLIDEFSENTVTNYYFPYGIAPNFLINAKNYCVPMVIEESSVVAAAAKSAKFWSTRGGFQAKVISTTKLGQVHFYWPGEPHKLVEIFQSHLKSELLNSTEDLTASMRSRGGGLKDITLLDKTALEKNYYQLMVSFETCEAMGANFINSVLERLGEKLKALVGKQEQLSIDERSIEIVLCILTNYTPDCLVEASVCCEFDKLEDGTLNMSVQQFVDRFSKAVRIAQIDPYRAVTHNKGIFNGIDAFVIATGNDFRAVEACGHAYAARSGQYSGLTSIHLTKNTFSYSLRMPIAMGAIGGLTTLHPMARASFNILGNPNAQDLMQIAACTGLASNFGALKALVTTGIQKGHMKMHLLNILRNLEATEGEIKMAKAHFKEQVISFNGVKEFIGKIRKLH